ncbi:hypothetical protein D3C72_1192050 [compost metagenome]
MRSFSPSFTFSPALATNWRARSFFTGSNSSWPSAPGFSLASRSSIISAGRSADAFCTVASLSLATVQLLRM